MFKIATLPQLAIRRHNPLASVASAHSAAVATTRTSRPATAEIRIRKFEDTSVNDESYSAILPRDARSPIDLMRAITEACKDLPEFQIRNEADEQFILTLTLKA